MSRTGYLVLAFSMALGHISGQTIEKELLEQTLHQLAQELPTDRGGPEVEWLLSAAQRWEPIQRDEGADFRKSLQLMLREIHRARRDGTYRTLLTVVSDDLKIKRDYCRAHGLTAEQRVEVRTKREGLWEVKGLEVWYIEKFLALDPTADPHRFSGFSSPVSGRFVPGRYLFWAKNPTSGKSGEKVEQVVSRVTLRQPDKTAIELLAP